jgi:hypothetical protein
MYFKSNTMKYLCSHRKLYILHKCKIPTEFCVQLNHWKPEVTNPQNWKKKKLSQCIWFTTCPFTLYQTWLIHSWSTMLHSGNFFWKRYWDYSYSSQGWLNNKHGHNKQLRMFYWSQWKNKNKNLEYIQHEDNFTHKHKILDYCSFCQIYRCTVFSDIISCLCK